MPRWHVSKSARQSKHAHKEKLAQANTIHDYYYYSAAPRQYMVSYLLLQLSSRLLGLLPNFPLYTCSQIAGKLRTSLLVPTPCVVSPLYARTEMWLAAMYSQQMMQTSKGFPAAPSKLFQTRPVDAA